VRRSIEHAWIVATLVYAAFRIALAQRFLAKYGLNVGWFALLEVLSSLLFGLASGRFVGAVLDRHRRAFGWAGLTVVGYAAPDAYVFKSTHRLPRGLLAVMLVFIALSMAVSFFSLQHRLREERAALAVENVENVASCEPDDSTTSGVTNRS
jgi:lysylphosphatidylglycerol synthetase-like protein (DUF2156 family)